MNLRPKRKIFAKKRVESKSVTSFIQNKKEKWYSFGDVKKFHEVYELKFQGKPLNFLIKQKNKKPNIMVLGAGEGKDLKLLKRFCKKHKKEPVIDVLSLTKALPKTVKKIVNKDYSNNKALETIDLERDKKLISEIKNKYDLVMAPLSVGVYTNHQTYNMFLSAMMLKNEGRTYIQVRFTKDLEKRFDRFVKAYNKQNKTNYKFNLNLINSKKYTQNKVLDKFYSRYMFYEIKRIN